MAEENKNSLRTKPVILLIEDEGLLTRMYSKKLEHDGFECITSTNGKNGLEVALSEQPELIVCDVMMPEMDGLTVLSQLKEHEETKHIPVIMLSNVSNQEYVERALELGAVSYLIKSELVPADVVSEIKEKLEATGKKSLVIG
ncbi:MAG: response regulator [Candidatus Dojkabacteria bacterium]|nr:response regulator [Candidatus Dojkabacteria bacterium]MDQ7021795.1 response regulator [Candidatus Dojkabacteria bacterium]